MESGHKKERALSGHTTRGKCQKNIGIRIFTIVGTMVGQLAYLFANVPQLKQEDLNGSQKVSAGMIG